MKTTIDSAGRLVIPAVIRRQAGLRPGMELEVSVRDGGVVIEPAPVPVHLERRGRFLVAVPDKEGAVLTDEIVQETRARILEERSPL